MRTRVTVVLNPSVLTTLGKKFLNPLLWGVSMCRDRGRGDCVRCEVEVVQEAE